MTQELKKLIDYNEKIYKRHKKNENNIALKDYYDQIFFPRVEKDLAKKIVKSKNFVNEKIKPTSKKNKLIYKN